VWNRGRFRGRFRVSTSYYPVIVVTKILHIIYMGNWTVKGCVPAIFNFFYKLYRSHLIFLLIENSSKKVSLM